MSVDKDGLSVGQPGGTPEVRDELSVVSVDLTPERVEELSVVSSWPDYNSAAYDPWLNRDEHRATLEVSVLDQALTALSAVSAISAVSATPAPVPAIDSEFVGCPKCGHTRCRAEYVPSTPPGRFLFWKWEGRAERLELTCAFCGFTRSAPVGTRFMVLGS